MKGTGSPEDAPASQAKPGSGRGTKRRLQDASATCRSLCRVGTARTNFIFRINRRTGPGAGGKGASRNTATFAVSRERRAGTAFTGRMPTWQHKISCSVGGSWLHGAVTGRISGLSRCVPGWAKRKQNSTQNLYFVNRTAQRFHFHTPHGGDLYALTSMSVW